MITSGYQEFAAPGNIHIHETKENISILNTGMRLAMCTVPQPEKTYLSVFISV